MTAGGRLRTKDSVGGTPTGAVETTALPRKSLMIWEHEVKQISIMAF
jgi:hypothetical protein